VYYTIGMHHVLIIDDSEFERKILTKTLEADGYKTSAASDAASGLAAMRTTSPDLVLLDVVMPGRSGLEALGDIVADERLSRIPVIMVTAKTDAADAQAALDAGAVDYIRKPFEAIEIRARARSALRIRDYQERLRFLSSHDGLTGLLNHVEILSAVERAVAQPKGKGFSLALLDVDHFKSVNDSRGHQFGDKVLARIGLALAEAFPAPTPVGRYGGEEFMVLLPGYDLGMARLSVDAFRRLVEALEWEDAQGQRVTISAGLAEYASAEPLDAASLINRADEALYRAKRGGRNRVEG